MKVVVYQAPIQYRRGKCARPGAATPQRWHHEDHFLLYLWLGLAHVRGADGSAARNHLRP